MGMAMENLQKSGISFLDRSILKQLGITMFKGLNFVNMTVLQPY